jgi:hypothetical protein
VKGIIRIQEITQAAACFLCLTMSFGGKFNPVIWSSLVDISVFISF